MSRARPRVWLRNPASAQDTALPSGIEREQFLRQAERLKQHEQETIDACRSLKSQLSDEARNPLEGLLDAMALDSEKHYGLLLAVERILKPQA